MKETKQITGEIHAPVDKGGPLFMVVFVGTAKGHAEGQPEGVEKEYEMLVSAGNYSPFIQSKLTGKRWHIGWQDLINMAIDAGIDVE